MRRPLRISGEREMPARTMAYGLPPGGSRAFSAPQSVECFSISIETTAPPFLQRRARQKSRSFACYWPDDQAHSDRRDTQTLIIINVIMDGLAVIGNVVESIDKKTGAVTKWPLRDLRANYAMALNEEDHRLFTITRKTPMMVVLDTQTGKEVARLRAAGECDDVFFDATRGYGKRCITGRSILRKLIVANAQSG